MNGNNEVSLLDIAVLVAENWMAIAIFPAIVAFGAYLFSASQPGFYSASAILPIPTAIEEPATSDNQAEILPVIPQEAYAVIFDGRQSVDVSLSEEAISISARAETAELASGLVQQTYVEIANAFIADAEAKRADATRVINQGTPILRLLEQSLADSPDSSVALLQAQIFLAPYRHQFDEAAAAIDSLQAPPTINTASNDRLTLIYVAAAWIAAVLLVLSVVVLRHVLHTLAASSEGQKKFARIASTLRHKKEKSGL